MAESVASRIQASLRQPFEVAGTELYVTASLGISLFPRHADDAGTLMKHADNAMFRSKQLGPGGSFLHAASDVDAMGRLSLSTRLRKAVENQSWMLHYQPHGRSPHGRTVGVESLMRWPDPGGGLISAGRIHPARRGDGADRGDRRMGGRGSAGPIALWRNEGHSLEFRFNLSPTAAVGARPRRQA